MADRKDFEPGQIFHRQLDIFDPEEFDVPVHIIGVGATGSFDALALAKLGISDIHIWDDDVVEIKNTSGQIYGLDDDKRYKVAALGDIIHRLANIEVTEHNKRWNGQPLNGIVIIGVDSIDTRREIFESVKFKPNVHLVVDHRIGGHHAQVFMFSPTDIDAIEDFETTLFKSENAAQLPCTLRSVIDINWFVASMAARGIRSFLKEGASAITYEMHYNSQTCSFVKREPGGAYKTLV